LTPTLTFLCSICGEPSRTICVYCTKDACGNHLCERCRRCSDCCECELRLDEFPEHERPAQVAETAPSVLDEVIIMEDPIAPEEPAVSFDPAPEPEPVVNDPPPPPVVTPDLSKLFAPEPPPDKPAPPVFPITHAPPQEPETEPESDPD
jgi:hypothetical protein